MVLIHGAPARPTAPDAVADRPLLAWLLAAAAVWQIGAHVDAWYHAHRGFAIESFLTWPHALLYAGWLAVCLVALPLGRAEPAPAPGTRLALAGAALFGVGGLLDFAWHQAFGFEASLATLFSPSHVWLVASALVTAVGVLAAAVDRRRLRARAGRAGARDGLVVALALAFVLRLSRYLLFYSEPLSVDYASGGAIAGRLPSAAVMGWGTVAAQVAGTTGIVLHSVLLALFVLVGLRRLRLPAGGLALVLGWDALLTAAVDDLWRYLPAVAAAAVAGELLWALVRRGLLGGPDAAAGYWLIAAVVPAVQFDAYFALMAAYDGIIWPIHLWAGVPIVAALYGLIVSLLLLPPRWLGRD
ncbi:MAG TPA: hypothetical protein VGL23_02615 [Chloroflexota bacterium]